MFSPHQSEVSQKPGKQQHPLAPKSLLLSLSSLGTVKVERRQHIFGTGGFHRRHLGGSQLFWLLHRQQSAAAFSSTPTALCTENSTEKKCQGGWVFSQFAFLPCCSVCNISNLHDCYHTLKHLAFLLGNAPQGILWYGRNQDSTKKNPSEKKKK